MYKNSRAFIVLFSLFITACAPRIVLNIDQTSLIPKESAVQYLQSYDWNLPRRVAKIKKYCGEFTDTTFAGYPYEQLTVTFHGGPFHASIETDGGVNVCGEGNNRYSIVMQSKSGFGPSESDLKNAERFTQAFVSLGGKYEYSGL